MDWYTWSWIAVAAVVVFSSIILYNLDDLRSGVGLVLIVGVILASLLLGASMATGLFWSQSPGPAPNMFWCQ